MYNLHIPHNQALYFDTIREELFRITLSEPNHPWRSLYTSFISFFGEYEYQKSIFSLRDQTGSYGHFFMYLFRSCLLFESLLKENEMIPLKKNIKVLSMALKKLQPYLNIGEANIRIGNTNLQDVLLDVDNYRLEIPNSIKITGKLRNTIGHNLVWKTELDSNQFEKLFFCHSIFMPACDKLSLQSIIN